MISMLLANERRGPSQAARDLVRGAYDLHVHVAPDLIPRRVGDVELARRFAAVGLAGFVLKSHYVPTQERAASVRSLGLGAQALGSLTLNSAVGGINPVAVEIAAREGARVVWFPTFDARNETAGRTPVAPGDHLPVWAKLQHELRADGVHTPVVDVVDARGEALPETVAVIEAIARHQLVLATGHLARDEIFTVVDVARAAGVRDVVITHPDYPSQGLSIADQLALVERGAVLERCFAPCFTGQVPFARVLESTRRTGCASTFLSSDLGQKANPPVEDGLALFAEVFLDAGFAEEDVHHMAVVNTRRLGASS
jgi:hypothetical protein